MWHINLSLPLKLTIARLIFGLILLPFFLVFLLPINSIIINCVLMTLFLCVGATDFFDGYFARKYNQVSSLGATLDHLADKCLLYATLVALVAVHKISTMWAIVWIGREFLILGLRILSLENGFSIKVSSFGKSKTVTQIICLAFIIGNSYQHLGMQAMWWNGSEMILIIASTFLSLFSAYKYTESFIMLYSEQTHTIDT